jgi:putative ABC transport system permease protein
MIPTPFRRAFLRLRAIVFRRGLDDDMQAEMRQHLDSATARYVARGMSQADARLAGQREFGNLTVLQEEARDARGARWVDALAGDVRFAVRYFARHKVTTTILVAVIALGTGTNALIFSIFQSQFLRPAPAVPENAAHALIWGRERLTRAAEWQPRRFSERDLAALSERRDIFHDVAAWAEDEVIVDGGDSTGARAVGAQFVTPNFFGALGVRVAAGREFLWSAGDKPDMTVVLSYAIAEQLYGNAPAALGRRILVNDVPVYVVGVAPPRFQGARRNMDNAAIWIPMSARADLTQVPRSRPTDEAELSLLTRLAPGVSRDRATALARLVVANALPDSAARVGMARTAYVLAMHTLPPGDDRTEDIFVFAALMTLGVLVLLVAWTNVSSLIVAAAVGRRHEIAVRLSLGASRLRIVRQLVTESTLFALAGSAAGLMLAWWTLTYLAKTGFAGADVAPDLGTFVFVLAMGFATGILFGLSPALHATRGGVAHALRGSGTGTRSRSRLQRGFVVIQIALSQPLLVVLGAVLSQAVADYRPLSPEMSRQTIAIGFRPLATGAPSQRPEAIASLVTRIAGRPEVAGASHEPSLVAVHDVHTKADTARVQLEGAPPGWLALVDVPVILGRDVSLADTAASDYPVVIGSDLARGLWGDASPLGQTISSPAGRAPNADSITMTVVGVFDATRRLPETASSQGIGRTNAPARVFTARGKRWKSDGVLVRTRGPAATFVPELQRFVRAQAPSLPVVSMLTLEQADQRTYQATLRMSALAGAGGALPLLLASLGLFGVVSLAVRQRTREIAIRIAVGAKPMQVARMFLGSGVSVSLLGVMLGLPLSIAALSLGLSPVFTPQVNPSVIGTVTAVVLVTVASAATWIPARQAALVDPARTLRVE